MRFRCVFSCDNAAFDGDERAYEIGSILETVAKRVFNGDTDGHCRDSNGNTVGEWSIDGTPIDTDDEITDHDRALYYGETGELPDDTS